MGSVSIDISLENIWQSWFDFRRGKRRTLELDYFQYFLEGNLYQIFTDLNRGTYKHGTYKKFIVTDNKKREICVASIRDRVVHRLMYEYLVRIYDHTFIYDAWSCRRGKGLVGAIERTQSFLGQFRESFVWRTDITKFFDRVSQETLFTLVSRRIQDKKALELIEEIITNYTEPQKHSPGQMKRGMPIGNLTSQIFANIYLNELDRFVKHTVKPQAYVRYGDDFILIVKDKEDLQKKREEVIAFINDQLSLEINKKHDIILPVKRGLHYLGVEIFPHGRRLKKRNWKRAQERLTLLNFASYRGLVQKHDCDKKKLYFDWKILEHLNSLE